MIQLPLFPLPDYVLFPRTHSALHLFEPRYLAMAEDVLAGDRRIAMAHLRPGYEKDYFEAPKVFRVVTIARVVRDERMEDGCFNILLEGEQRAELRGETGGQPYRIGRLEPLTDVWDMSRAAEATRDAREVASLAEHIARVLSQQPRHLFNMVDTFQHPSIIADVAVSTLVADPYARQSLLEELDVHRRLKLAIVQLRQIVERLPAGDISLPSTES
jgi:Lon protease-like protein